mmetsp:Transcript_31375/g.93217  ORF Transcript_31375/g.93217 Transcript_31375/m.93217 type:complete len:196 (+) Transcript_31375:20-607(+)
MLALISSTASLGFTLPSSAAAVGGARCSAVEMISVGEKLPKSVLSKAGLSGKKGALFFYGADDAPSCSKELSEFEGSLADFDARGVSVVGVRNGAGAKGYDGPIRVIVDDGDEMREELAIEKDLFGLLGGRETYVVDQSGTVVSVHNNQFDPKSHVTTALAAAESLPAGAPNPFEAFAEALSSLKPPELPALGGN